MKIGAVSLGCDKNRVDTEKMLSRLVAAGHETVGNAEDADVIIVNTCAFIDAAKEESIDEILSAAEVKKRYPNKKLIVTGCLSERYPTALEGEFPEVDAFFGVADYDDIVASIEKIFAGDKLFCYGSGDVFYSGRVLTTPYHYAYLKIADGCDNCCTYCAIPSIRGKYRSEKPDDLLKEAKELADGGVKELILVAQDVTRYGVDFDGKPHLIELVRELEKLFDRIRLLYLEPEMVDDELIDFIASEPKVVKYADIPLQHIDDGVLKRMNRRTTEAYTRGLVRKLKNKGIAVRSTFICGFPGESEEAFNKLKSFISESEIDYAGFFAYSREEGTPADKLPGHIDARERERRAEILREIQRKNMEKAAAASVGKTYRVIYDDIEYDKQTFSGRTEFMTPDADNRVLFKSDRPVDVGCFYDVLITGTDGIDLVGRVVNDNFEAIGD